MASYEHKRNTTTRNANNEREECFLHLVKVTHLNIKDNLELSAAALESVLETTEGRPLVIFNVGDNQNSHSSVLLNRIKCSIEALENESTISKTQIPPCDFDENQESEGIWIWSRALLLDKEDCDIAVILLHSYHATVSSAIFGLGILLSSAAVYKIDANQVENALNSLQTVFKFGQLCIENAIDLLDDQKPFQALCFLFHGLMTPFENSNLEGRNAYLDEIVESLDEDKKKVTRNGLNGFQQVVEFLHNQNTHTENQMDSKLETFLHNLVKNDDIMSKKQILGKNISPSEFTNYFQEYISMFNTNGINSEEFVTEDVLWNSTCAVYHKNIISSCIPAYETSFQRNIKSIKLPSDHILQKAHSTALKQAKIHLKRAKMLDSCRQSYENELISNLEASFQETLAENKIIRKNAIKNCSKRIVDKFKTQLHVLFPTNDGLVSYEEAEISPKVERLKHNLSSEFQEEFEDDDEEDIMDAVNSLQQNFQNVIESFLEQQQTNADFAKTEANMFQEKLFQRYTDNMKQIIDKNSFMDADALTKFHNINFASVMKQFTSESLKGMPIDEIKKDFENSIQNEYSEFKKQQQSNFTKHLQEAESSINDEVEAFAYALLNKIENDPEMSELEFQDFQEKEIAVVVARFNKLYPFPSSSREEKHLRTKLQQSLEAEYQSQLGKLLRKLEESEGSCIQLYRKEMQALQGNADFLLEEELLDAHQKSLNNALQRYNKSQQKSVTNVEDFKRKIQTEFSTAKFQNLQRLEVARSNADNWMAECLNEYNSEMADYNSSCQTEDEFQLAHDETKEMAISLFSKRWQYSNVSLRQQYERELVKQMDPIFSELEDLFRMRMNAGNVSAGDSKEEVRKHYHEEMGKHFKNNQFIQPEELQLLHKVAVKAAIAICKKKVITSSQKKALKQWLESSFQRYKDRNDANLNWVGGTEPAIGIDLGTTYCCAAVLLQGEVKIIPNSQGKNTTPSYVTINQDGSYFVGNAAKDNAYRNAENTVFDAKRMIGRQMEDEQLKNDMSYWPFKIVKGENGPAVDISGKDYPPEEISSYLLKQIANDASTFLGKKIKKVVITVPAYFTDGQRAATLDAGELAGLEVLEILNEPTAAAIAYKLERFHEELRNVLIFDMGGGTFDVAVIKTDSTSIEVLSVDGDTHLGGEDFDKAMMHYCVNKFKEEHDIDPLQQINLVKKTDKDGTKQRLRRLQTNCEKAKVQLSFAPEVTISVDSFDSGIDLLITIAREEFEELIEPLFKKAIAIVDRVLKDAKTSKGDIHDIVLIGGSTRIPRVRELIIEYFEGKALNHTISPDEAVAYGSAVKAAIINGDQSKKMYNFKNIQDVIPRSLGIRTWLLDEEGKFTVIIPKSAKIPAEAKREFRTKLDNQVAVDIKIFQGEEQMADDNEYLGEFILSEIPPAPAGTETVEVCMRVNTMGILHVTAICKSTNGSETLVVSEKKGRLSKETKQRIKDKTKETKLSKSLSERPIQQLQSQKKSGILRRLTTFKKT